MTFYEFIRQCLLWDAKKHPFPKRFEGTAGQFIPREAEKPSAPTDTDEAQ